MIDSVVSIPFFKLLKSWKATVETGMKATTAIKLHWAILEKQTNVISKNFQGSSKKINVESPWVLVFDIWNSKGCHKPLQNFQDETFFSGIFKGKVTNLKIQGRGDPPLTPSPPRHTHTHTHTQRSIFKSCHNKIF